MRRNLIAHRANLAEARERTGKYRPFEFCARCSDVWCKFNTTPTSLLPTGDSAGEVCQHTCSFSERDKEIPSEN